MNPFLNFDLEKTLSVLDRISENYDDSSEERAAIETARFSILMGGKDISSNFESRGKAAYNYLREHLDSSNTPPTKAQLKHLAVLSEFSDQDDNSEC